MIRAIALFSLGFLALLFTVFRTTLTDDRADLVYLNPSGIHTLDPARMSWTQDFRVALNIWEGLTTWDPQTLKPVEGAARLPPEVSDDQLTYTFQIRPDGRWSNGDSVVAGDFIRGWRRAMEPGTAADYSFFFTDFIEGAAEYVTWRHQMVGVLGGLDRLGSGWSLDEAQRDRMRFDPEAAAHLRSESTVEDWRRLHRRTLARYDAEMETRFAAVGLTAPDDLTLVVQLRRPCPYLLDLTSFPTFLPIHASVETLREHVEDASITAQGLVVYDPQWTKPDYHRVGYPGLISNGPYRLADWRFKRSLRMEVNPFFRDAPTIRCRSVEMATYDNISAAIMAYESGQIDFLPSMVTSYDHEIARLAQSGERSDFHICQTASTQLLNFNCVSEAVGPDPNPFRDSRLRKAFSLTIDRKTIVQDVLRRGDRPADSFVPRGFVANYDPPHVPTRDAPQARALLSEAGFPGGVGLPAIDFLHTASDARLCQAVARMWENELGVRVNLRNKESKTFAEDKAGHRFMVTRGNWYADYADPTTFLDCLLTGNGNNDSGYSDATYDRLMSEARAETDAARRYDLLRRAESKILTEDFPLIPILHYSEPIAIKPYVTGLHTNSRMWFPFRHVTVQR